MANTLDWRDLRRTSRLRAYMVPPHSLEDYYEELTGIIWGSCSFSANYDTDTRTQGQLVFVGDNWIRNSWIRIVYEIPEWDYSRVLGTYVVTNDDARRENGQWKTTLELNSTLYAMNLHQPETALILAANSSTSAAMAYIFDDDERVHLMDNANDVRIASTQVIEAGKSELARLYTVANLSNNRVDVDGFGRVVVEPYVSPATKQASITLDLQDPRGVVYDGVERSTDWHKIPTESVVVYRYSENVNGKSEQYEITAKATVANTSHAAAGIRGYTLTDFHSETELSPATQAQAQYVAENYLENASVESCEWNIKTKYLPVWESDVIELIIPDGREEYSGRRKCLVKSVDLAGPYLDMTIKLKEIGGVV